jgi:penicillin-binding protein 1C
MHSTVDREIQERLNAVLARRAEQFAGQGILNAASLVSDIPTRVGAYSPENISGGYLGVLPASEALARSLNIPAVRSLRNYGVIRFTSLLRSLGLNTLFRKGEDYGLPLILGGAEVNLWEMAGLYAGLVRSALEPDEPESLFFSPELGRDDNAGIRAGGNKREKTSWGYSRGSG